MKRVLLFGSLAPPDVMRDIPDASEAANRFQLDMSRGLVRSGVRRVTAITAITIATVPHPRRVFVHGAEWDLGDGIDIVAPGFVNLFPVKPASVHARLKSAGMRLEGSFDAVLAFSPTPIGHASAGLAVARKAGVPFVCITADYVPELRPRSLFRAVEQKLATRVVRGSDGLVVVSGHTPRDMSTDQPWIKIDGGVADDWERLPEVRPRVKTVVFAGTPDRMRGAPLLLDAFARIEDADMRVVFAGRGGMQDAIAAAAARDPRIEVKGFLSREEFRALLASATVLVNPRPSSAQENRHNFPAKLLDYLASGRPVVTTLAGDLDPVYVEVTMPLYDETPEALAVLLREVCSWDEARRVAFGRRGRAFVLRERTWDRQAARIGDFLGQLAG